MQTFLQPSTTAPHPPRAPAAPAAPPRVAPPTDLPAEPGSAAERADLAACRAALRNGSRTFLAASLLLPRAVHEPACALYAFCRLADDAVDGADASSDLRPSAGAGAAIAAVEALRERLALVYRGTPQATPADRALATVVRRFSIPRALLDALLDGFEWDALGRHHDSFDDLCDYAARVAGTVGAMMALLMGARSRAAVARACDLGVAMQLSNIARDVGEDARLGRLYLPRQWLREAGIDPDAWLASPTVSPALGGVVQRLLDAADVLYRRADAGVARLPWACRPGIHAARFLYADIGHEVARRGLDSVTQRAVVPPRRKAWLLMQALALASFGLRTERGAPNPPALPATRFLVDAVGAAPARRPLPPPAWWQVRQRGLWVIALFERLEQRDRIALPRSSA